MNAVEFFKSMGLDAVKQFIKNGNIRTAEMKDELKRLVESHEFVVANGGLDGAKEYCDLHDPNRRSKHYNSLRNKIADVEACQ